MILTQTLIETGMKSLWPQGSIYLELEPIDNQGYGGTREACVKVMNERFEKEYPGMYLLNAKYSFRPGLGHPSYNRYFITLIGDLYKCVP